MADLFTEEEKVEIIVTVVEKRHRYGEGFCPFYPDNELPCPCNNKHCRKIFPNCSPDCPCTVYEEIDDKYVVPTFWKAME